MLYARLLGVWKPSVKNNGRYMMKLSGNISNMPSNKFVVFLRYIGNICRICLCDGSNKELGKLARCLFATTATYYLCFIEFVQPNYAAYLIVYLRL